MSTARKTLQTFVSHMLIIVHGFLITPLIIKVSGTETYGVYVLLLSYLGMMIGISSLGVGIRAKRWLPSHDDPKEREVLFLPQFTFQLLSLIVLSILTLVIYLAGEKFSWWGATEFWPWLIPMFLLFYAVYSQFSDYFRYTHRTGWFNFSTISQPYLFILIVFIWYQITLSLNLNILFSAHVAASAIVCGVLIVKIGREIRLRPRLSSFAEYRNEIIIGFPIILSYLVDVFLAAGDRYIIAAYMGASDVGQYAAAYAVGSLVLILAKVFGIILPPILSRMQDSNDVEASRRLIAIAIRSFLVLAIPFSVGAWLLSKDILVLYANSEVADAAWLVVPIVALGAIFYGLVLIYSNVLFVQLKTVDLLKVNLIAVLLNIILNIVLIYFFRNIILAAVATLFSYLVSYIWLRGNLISSKMHVEIPGSWIAKLTLAALVMGGAIAVSLGQLESYTVTIRIACGFLVGFLVYGSILLIFKGLIGEELAVLKNIWVKA